MNKDLVIKDYQKTIKRLQQECTEKTDIIIRLGTQITDLIQREIKIEQIIKDAANAPRGFEYHYAVGALNEIEDILGEKIDE